MIIAGDSFQPIELVDEMEILLNPRAAKNLPRAIIEGTPPNEVLGAFLLDVGRSLPIHLMPGERDPAAHSLPQQPLPRGMFGDIKSSKGFKCETNPTWLSIEGCQSVFGVYVYSKGTY